MQEERASVGQIEEGCDNITAVDDEIRGNVARNWASSAVPSFPPKDG